MVGWGLFLSLFMRLVSSESILRREVSDLLYVHSVAAGTEFCAGAAQQCTHVSFGNF